MSVEPLDVAVIGAGTAGLSAREEVAKATDRYRVFDPGPYGTTCARNACMPSKALLQSAHDFHRRHAFAALGIAGAEHLRVDAGRVLAETRALRDDLVAAVLEDMESWRATHLVPHAPVCEADGTLRAGGRRFRPRATVVATGSRPVVPGPWRARLGERVMTSDDVFELEDLPARVAVVGLGPVGLELGQALARLGVEVTGFDPAPSIGGLSDPALQSRLRAALEAEMTVVAAEIDPAPAADGAVAIRWDGGEIEVDRVLAAMGRRPNLEGLGLEALGVDLEAGGPGALPVDRLDLPGPNLHFAGDCGPGPALLHEAADEGRIAGRAAARGEAAAFRRRAPLRLVFSDPQIAVVGADHAELEARGEEVVAGEADFDASGRTRLQRSGGGAVRVYAERASARLLGAAVVAPAAEHLGHLLARAVERGEDLRELLRMPAYHPTHEEVLRRALRAALARCDVEVDPLEEIRCADTPVDRDAAGGAAEARARASA